jgi:hypothetical protein
MTTILFYIYRNIDVVLDCFSPSVFRDCFSPSVFRDCFSPSVFRDCFSPSVFRDCYSPSVFRDCSTVIRRFNYTATKREVTMIWNHICPQVDGTSMFAQAKKGSYGSCEFESCQARCPRYNIMR